MVVGAKDMVMLLVEQVCDNDENGMEGLEVVTDANNLLIEKGFFAQEFCDGVQVQFCATLPFGLPVAENKLFLSAGNRFFSTERLAGVLAHEYTHIVQFRSMGREDFQCKYLEYALTGGGIGAENPIEAEALQFEAKVNDCIYNNAGCPSDDEVLEGSEGGGRRMRGQK